MATVCGFEAPAIEPLPFEELLGETADSQSDVSQRKEFIFLEWQLQSV